MSAPDGDAPPPAPSRRALIVAAMVAGAILLGFLGWRLVISLSDDAILLRPQLVDPRDPFRGDYVILSYPESRLELAAYGHAAGSFADGDTLYLVFAPGDPTSTPTRVTKTSPSLSANEACMKGEVVSASGGEVRVTYGIESYFVPEGRGHEAENAIREGRVLARIMSGPGCAAGLDKLLIDGKPWP